MAEANIQEIVARLCDAAIDQRLAKLQQDVQTLLASQMADLRQEIATKIRTELSGFAAPGPASSSGTVERTGVLNAAIGSLYDGMTQADILKAMLDGMSQFSGRCALFVVRGTSLAGWQARGFSDNDGVKSLSISAASGLAARAIQSKVPAASAAAEFDSAAVQAWGNPVDGNGIVLPLVVRDKVPAVVYADAGTDVRSFDRGALEILLRAASSWLEIIALRKGAPAEEHHAPATAVAESQAAAASVATPATPSVAASPVPVSSVAPSSSPMSAEEELHKKAKRFAKLLVDEIKLYNAAKVAEGKTNRDLYDRLREDIDKSRATFDKRYTGTSVADADYFSSELVRVLADGDLALLGPNYQG